MLLPIGGYFARKRNTTVAAMPSVVVELTYDRKGSAKAWCSSLAAGSAFIAKASLAAGA
jgi:hypothetical protein